MWRRVWQTPLQCICSARWVTNPYRGQFEGASAPPTTPRAEVKQHVNRVVSPGMNYSAAGFDSASSTFYHLQGSGTSASLNDLSAPSPVKSGMPVETQLIQPPAMFSPDHSLLRNLIPLRVKGSGPVSALLRHAFLQRDYLITRFFSSLEHVPLPAVPRMLLAEAMQQLLEGTKPQRDLRRLFEDAEVECRKMLQSLDYSADDPGAFERFTHRRDKALKRVHSDPYYRLLAYELFAACCYYAQMLAVSSEPEVSATVLLRTIIAADIRTDDLLRAATLDFESLPRHTHNGQIITDEERLQETQKRRSLIGRLSAIGARMIDPLAESQDAGDARRYYVDPDDLRASKGPLLSSPGAADSDKAEPMLPSSLPMALQVYIKEMLLLERDSFGEFRFDPRGDNRHLFHTIKLEDVTKTAEAFAVSLDPLIRRHGNLVVLREAIFEGRWAKYRIYCGKEDCRVDERLPALETIVVKAADDSTVASPFTTAVGYVSGRGEKSRDIAPSESGGSTTASVPATQPLPSPSRGGGSQWTRRRPPLAPRGADMDRDLQLVVYYDLPLCVRHKTTSREGKGDLAHVEEFELAVHDKNRTFFERYFLDR